MQSVIVNENPSASDLVFGFKDTRFTLERIENRLNDILDVTDDRDELTSEECDAIKVAAESGHRLCGNLLEVIDRTITRRQLSGENEHGR